MDRAGQLRNVAFGGAWSEQIAGDEVLAQAMMTVADAAERTRCDDLRGDVAVADAIDQLAAAHPKGAALRAAWAHALDISNGGLRCAELLRLATAFRRGLGDRVR